MNPVLWFDWYNIIGDIIKNESKQFFLLTC